MNTTETAGLVPIEDLAEPEEVLDDSGSLGALMLKSTASVGRAFVSCRVSPVD